MLLFKVSYLALWSCTMMYSPLVCPESTMPPCNVLYRSTTILLQERADWYYVLNKDKHTE